MDKLPDELREALLRAAKAAAQRVISGQWISCPDFMGLLEAEGDHRLTNKLTVERIYTESSHTMPQEVHILLCYKTTYYLVAFQVYLPDGFKNLHHSTITITHLPNRWAGMEKSIGSLLEEWE